MLLKELVKLIEINGISERANLSYDDTSENHWKKNKIETDADNESIENITYAIENNTLSIDGDGVIKITFKNNYDKSIVDTLHKNIGVVLCPKKATHAARKNIVLAAMKKYWATSSNKIAITAPFYANGDCNVMCNLRIQKSQSFAPGGRPTYTPKVSSWVNVNTPGISHYIKSTNHIITAKIANCLNQWWQDHTSTFSAEDIEKEKHILEALCLEE